VKDPFPLRKGREKNKIGCCELEKRKEEKRLWLLDLIIKERKKSSRQVHASPFHNLEVSQVLPLGLLFFFLFCNDHFIFSFR
jgi:hypothetical protein